MKKPFAAVLVATSILVGVPGTAAAETTGSQNFRVINVGPPSNEGRVVATGIATGVGTAVTPQGQGPTPFPALIVLDDGTLFLTITPTGNEFQFDPRTCILSGPFFGTYEVTGGTGEFSGATGGGVFRGRLLLLFGRSQGACVDPASNPPIHVVQIIENPGTLTLPGS